jgi:hypothetical protein
VLRGDAPLAAAERALRALFVELPDDVVHLATPPWTWTTAARPLRSA